jgi:murein DD-endopeptidase MepM/ murein hydrolase activator NlpD
MIAVAARAEPPPLPCDVPAVRLLDFERPGGGVRLVARVGTTVPVTVVLTATTVNMTPDVTFPVLRTLPGAGEYVLADLRFTKPGAAWHFDWKYDSRTGNLEARHDERVVYELPWSAGEGHKVGQGPHNSASWYQGGCALDFDMPERTVVCAARDGVVAGFQDECAKAGPTGTPSNWIAIAHADGTLGDYEHLRRGGVTVRVGQRVRAGEPIGYSGNTGASSGPHLHFGVLSVTRDLAWAPQRLRFRVAWEAVPVELVAGRTYTRFSPAR